MNLFFILLDFFVPYLVRIIQVPASVLNEFIRVRVQLQNARGFPILFLMQSSNYSSCGKTHSFAYYFISARCSFTISPTQLVVYEGLR
jgi:hypothetical protein